VGREENTLLQAARVDARPPQGLGDRSLCCPETVDGRVRVEVDELPQSRVFGDGGTRSRAAVGEDSTTWRAAALSGELEGFAGAA
jgi:hypothetical protein